MGDTGLRVLATDLVVDVSIHHGQHEALSINCTLGGASSSGVGWGGRSRRVLARWNMPGLVESSRGVMGDGTGGSSSFLQLQDWG